MDKFEKKLWISIGGTVLILCAAVCIFFSVTKENIELTPVPAGFEANQDGSLPSTTQVENMETDIAGTEDGATSPSLDSDLEASSDNEQPNDVDTDAASDNAKTADDANKSKQTGSVLESDIKGEVLDSTGKSSNGSSKVVAANGNGMDSIDREINETIESLGVGTYVGSDDSEVYFGDISSSETQSGDTVSAGTGITTESGQYTDTESKQYSSKSDYVDTSEFIEEKPSDANAEDEPENTDTEPEKKNNVSYELPIVQIK